MDNDVSATRAKPRQEYERLLRDMDSGKVEAVVVWALDRLHRRPVELEQFMDLAERRGVLLASVAGEVDLSTGDGQFHARIMGAVAAKERAPSAAVSAASNRSCANRASPSVAGSAPTATARTA